jgi:hypothetical protein
MITSGATVPVGRKETTPRLRSVDLSGPAGRLEAVINEGSAHASFAALVCHPHPKGGGTLHNKVVYHAMKALNAPEWGLEWPVLRFNFRGTGLSEGRHHGHEEVDDVLAALNWLEIEYALPIVAVGFSFGAAMALKACSQTTTDVRAIAALGLPTHAEGRTYNYPFLPNLRLPKLFLSGAQDPYAPSAELGAVVAHAADPKQLVPVPGADHFFAGQLQVVQASLTGWLKKQVL